MTIQKTIQQSGRWLLRGADWLEKRPGLAAWASAFAAVVALGLTLWLAYSNSRQAEEQSATAAVSYGRQAAAINDVYQREIEAFAQRMESTPPSERDNVHQRDRLQFITLDGLSYDVFLLGHSLRVDLMPKAKIDHFMQIRMAVAEGVTLRARFNQGGNQAGGAPLSKAELEQYAQSFKALSTISSDLKAHSWHRFRALKGASACRLNPPQRRSGSGFGQPQQREVFGAASGATFGVSLEARLRPHLWGRWIQLSKNTTPATRGPCPSPAEGKNFRNFP